ncbi:MAG: TIR domain-containing protein [Clostridia bacterium]|nr:TIR domain-containing protein [Clostridia bacterium]
MAIFKCKMCGASLEAEEGASVVVCDYCETKQTLPTAKDENLQGLFNRANTLRLKSDFDKAEQVYEKILQNSPTEAEAYWGLILCKYGIEYVEDKTTFKRVPTCHRTSFDSIISDDDYKAAIENADAVQRGIYESEAKEIDRIQKEILAISAKEDPYDVFICYKEKDTTGRRTQDSVIANDIYYQLTKEGFKVFYAAITLEDKLGSAYEPCIFAALNSARVMLAIGTKPEHFNAVWVKNEWSRFLKMMKSDRDKLLIPCYKDMDAYELPEEFSHLQAQDMSKIGFINDIIRGVGKLLDKNEAVTPVIQTVAAVSDVDTEPLLKRMYIFLEDGDWKSADEYAERVLDRDPENALAYLGKLMAELNVKKRSDLENLANTFDSNAHYKKIIRFADDALAKELDGYNRSIIERNTERVYREAVAKMDSAKTRYDFEMAANHFKQVIDYKDSGALKEECHKRGRIANNDSTYDAACVRMKDDSIQGYGRAIKLFKGIIDWKDSEAKIDECKKRQQELWVKKNDADYEKAVQTMRADTLDGYNEAKRLFNSTIDFRDSRERIKICELNIKELKEIEEKKKELSTLKDQVTKCTKDIQKLEEECRMLPTERKCTNITNGVVFAIVAVFCGFLGVLCCNYYDDDMLFFAVLMFGVGIVLAICAVFMFTPVPSKEEIAANLQTISDNHYKILQKNEEFEQLEAKIKETEKRINNRQKFE